MQETRADAADCTSPTPTSLNGASVHTTASSSQRRAWPRRLALGCIVFLGLVGLGLGAVWWWMGQPQSLAWALQKATPHFMPTNQQLSTQGISGSLRHGGHITQLDWRGEQGQSLTAKDVHLRWDLGALLKQRIFQVHDLHIKNIDFTPAADPRSDATSTQPPAHLRLPVQVDARVRIDQLRWGADEALQTARNAQLHWRFDGTQHTLQMPTLDWAQAQWALNARADAAAPVQLSTELSATLQIDTARLQFQATAHGPLADPQGLLHLNAQLQDLRNAQPLAQVTVGVQPWAQQPLQQAQARLNGLDLSALAPHAPRTQLHGSVQAGSQPRHTRTDSTHSSASTVPTAWALEADIRNAAPASWQRQGLPLRHVQAQVLFDGQGQWSVPQLHVQALGAGRADATVALNAHANARTAALQVALRIKNLIPSALHPSWSARALSADLQLQGTLDAVRALPSTLALPSANTPPHAVAQTPDRLLGQKSLGWLPWLNSAHAGQTPLASAPLEPATLPEPNQLQGLLRLQHHGRAHTAAHLRSTAAASDTDAGAQARLAFAALALIDHAQTRVSWKQENNGHILHLDDVQLRHSDAAALSAQALRLHWMPPAASTADAHAAAHALLHAQQLNLHAPGLRAELQGTLAAHSGTGSIKVNLHNAATLQNWIKPWLQTVPTWGTQDRQPHTADWLSTQAEGQLNAQLNWTGGWQAWQAFIQGSPHASNAHSLQLQLSAPHLRLRTAQGADQTLRDAQLQLQGTPAKLQATLDGIAQWQNAPNALAQQLSLHSQTSLEARTNAPWLLQLHSLRAQWQPLSRSPVQRNATPAARALAAAQWQAALDAPVAVHWWPSPVRHAERVRIDAGTLTLRAQALPHASNIAPALPTQPLQLRWEAASMNTRNTKAAPKPFASPQSPVLWPQALAVRSRGSVQGLSLQWLPLATALAGHTGTQPVQGDLRVHAHWDVDTTATAPSDWRAMLDVQRVDGDVLVRTQLSDDGASAAASAGAAPVLITSTGLNARTPRTPHSGKNPEVEATQTLHQLNNPLVPMQVQALGAQLQLVQQRLQLNVLLQAQQTGTLNAVLSAALESQTGLGLALAHNAALTGGVHLDVPQLSAWTRLAPPGWRLGGKLLAHLNVSGTLNDPQLGGTITGDALSLSSQLDGIVLNRGRLRAMLEGSRLTLQELTLHGGQSSGSRILGPSGNLTSAPKEGGTLTASGHIALRDGALTGHTAGSPIEMDIRAQLRALQVLVRADRQVSASGQLNARVQDGQLAVQGALSIDRATLILADSSAPSLDSDVRIIRAEALADALNAEVAQPQDSASSMPALADLDLSLDLGPDFALSGYGLTTRLGGQLHMRASASQPEPIVTGQIHTIAGRYRAWGQSLDITSGTISFQQDWLDPVLDILAIRPNIPERVGVKITGSAFAPRVTLYSDTAMSDAERLSWVVLGRDPAAGGAEAAMLQQAALALLSGSGGQGNFAGKVGLDEIGLKMPNTDSGQAAALTLGKRISQDLYLSYEQSLSGAVGTLYILYDLSQRLTLRGQTGLQTALDLIYTHRRD